MPKEEAGEAEHRATKSGNTGGEDRNEMDRPRRQRKPNLRYQGLEWLAQEKRVVRNPTTSNVN